MTSKNKQTSRSLILPFTFPCPPFLHQDKVELGERLQDAHPYDVASLIKQFFRQLPDSLLTTRLHDTFLKCHHLEKGDERRQAVFLLCLLLPWPHLSTLRFFMQFLARVARHADQNKMDVSNLALCLAPNLLHMNLKAEKMRDSETKLLQVGISCGTALILALPPNSCLRPHQALRFI